MSGPLASISDCSAAAPMTPGSASPGSTAYTLVAPCSPSDPASASALAPTSTHSTTSATSRALVSSSSVLVAGLSPSASANTHTFASPIARSSVIRVRPAVSDDLERFEERDDALVRLAVVLDLLPRLARRGRRDLGDLLAGAGPADAVGGEAQVGRGHLVDLLVLRRHDPLERGVAGLDHTG